VAQHWVMYSPTPPVESAFWLITGSTARLVANPTAHGVLAEVT
jgi:hypothetical protein